MPTDTTPPASPAPISLDPHLCRGCGSLLNRAVLAYDDEPEDAPRPVEPGPGDIALCFTCGTLSAYTDDLRLRALTVEEVKTATLEPGFCSAVLAVWARVQTGSNLN